MYGFITLMKFWYLHTFFMTAVFSLVPVSPASRTVTLVLGFYINGFSYSLEVLDLYC